MTTDEDGTAVAARRSDARRNRQRVLRAARDALRAEGDFSMADLARRAGVGMATLYRNYPRKQALLEDLFTEEVDAVIAAADDGGAGPDAALATWLRRFVQFLPEKHRLAGEMLRQQGLHREVLDGARARILVAGRPLLAAAQARALVRGDLSLEQILDLLVAAAATSEDREYTGPLVDTVLDGLRAAGTR